MYVFVTFGSRVGVEDHGYAEPVALGKRHIQDLTHISLPLILLPYTDQTDINIRFLRLVELFAESRSAL